MKKLTALLLAAALATGTALAQENPSWVRKNSISPDGTKIAFSYKGDIFVVPVTGGRALQITTNEAYDSEPLWTADSKKIVFTSYREKSKDIFITSCEGGTPKRLTFHPGHETLRAVLPDGKILFSANIQQDAAFDGFPGEAQLYYTDTTGARPVIVTSLPISALSINKNGDILYEDWKGYEDPFRKHHTSAVTRDIWLYKGNSGKLSINAEGSFKKLSDFDGEDRNPVFAADGDTFYYLSERDGKALNVYKSSLRAPEKSVQLTFETKNPVRYLSIADNGTLAFSYNGDLYTMKDGQKPAKVDIKVYSDQDERDVERYALAGGASAIAIAPSQKEVALVLRGDVFVTSADYKTTKRITNTATQERDLSFSSDGRTIYYSAERDGNWGIWRTSLTKKEDKYFTYANDFKEELFSDEGETCFQPQVSPDGKYVAYLRDRTELVIKPTKGGKTISLIKGANYSYADGDVAFEWSPDSHYLLSTYQANGGWNNVDIALVDIETKEITNLTESGYNDVSFRWALGGKAMVWQSDKDGYRSHGSWGAEDDIYIMFFDGKAMTEFFRDKEDDEVAKLLNGEEKKAAKEEKKEEKKDSAATKKVEKLKLDLENRADRIYRLTRFSGRLGDHYLTNDGKKLFYESRLESSYDLCVRDMKEGSIKVLKKGVMGAIIPSPDGKYIYIASGSGISKIGVAGGESTISYSGDYEFKPKAEREYIFDHMWKQVKEKFYDPDLHGVDWDYYKENYSKFLPYINNNFDFQELLSEILGELNASHTGGRYQYRSGLNMGALGVLYDEDYEGDGLKIKEVLPDGVLSIAYPELKAGDIIASIDGNEIKAGKDWYSLLTGKAGKKTSITIKKGGKKDVEVFVKPAFTDYDLMYKRWVKQREAKVAELSGGKVGYVHVEGMNSPSYREVYSKALGKYRTAGALVVDTRHNGGGWLHDDLVTFLSGKAYVEYKPRGQYIGTDPYSKWTKPSCVLVCEDNYSDACGFPYAYQALGIGKLIGTPVAGTMTAVWWENQINSSIIFGIPQVGSWCIKDGYYNENHQVNPDILVYNDPVSMLKGEDKQLEAAVAEMLKEANK